MPIFFIYSIFKRNDYLCSDFFVHSEKSHLHYHFNNGFVTDEIAIKTAKYFKR